MIRRLLGLSLILLTAAVAALLWSVQTYRVLTREEMVAQIVCEPPLAGTEYTFVIQMTPIENGQPGRSEKFPMAGDQWAVGGDFLKWSPRLNLLGIPNRYKLSRLSSRYWTAADERSKPRTVYDLNGGTPAPWRWLYRYGIRLPFVDAVYGNTAYLPARPGEAWGVYVGLTGYLLRPLKE